MTHRFFPRAAGPGVPATKGSPGAPRSAALRTPLLSRGLLGLIICAVASATGAPMPTQAGDTAKTAYERTEPRTEVDVHDNLGQETVDITAIRGSLDAILHQIGRLTNREVKGLDSLSRHPEITAKLVGADLRDALVWIGGSVGMRITVTVSTIRIEEDLPPYPRRSELYARASASYIRALVDHPKSVLAPKASWNRAQIEASAPDRSLEAARAFDEITTTYPKSDLVPDALLEAGRYFGKANAWDEAAARFDTLAGFPREHGYSFTARRLLADAYTRVAEGSTNPIVASETAKRALLVLDFLDDADPTQDMNERRLRAIVRSRACSLTGDPVEALKSLDIAERYSDRGVDDPEIAELRARAFERAERFPSAVKAWLRYSSLVKGEKHAVALEQAAAASNKGRQFMATLAIAKTAENEGHGDRLKPFADAAYAGLDMEPTKLDFFGDAAKLTRGEQLLQKGLHDQVVDALRPVFERRATLPREERIRLAYAYAEALAKTDRLDEATLVLRKSTGELSRATDRKALYLFASRLLEKAGDVPRAIAALEGRL